MWAVEEWDSIGGQLKRGTVKEGMHGSMGVDRSMCTMTHVFQKFHRDGLPPIASLEEALFHV